MMTLGCDGVFVGSGIFKSEDSRERARSVVTAVTYFDDPKVVAESQKMIDERKSMMGIGTKDLSMKMQERGINA